MSADAILAQYNKLLSEWAELSEIERGNRVSLLRANPEFAAANQANYNALFDDLVKSKQAAFGKAYANMKLGKDAVYSATVFETRTNDLHQTVTSMKDTTSKAAAAIQQDIGTTRRQFEINEFYYNKGLDTVYVLQVAAIALLLTAAMIGAWREGFLAGSVTAMMVGFLLATASAIGLYKSYYNHNVRDKRFWHERYFKPMPQHETVPAAICPAGNEARYSAGGTDLPVPGDGGLTNVMSQVF
jgi:hypothetical protein